MTLPPDDHVHTEWSWDAPAGAMDRTCRRALALGLPAVAFTEHADLAPWTLPPGTDVPDSWRPLVTDGVLTPPPLDLEGYRRSLAECRERYPALRILSGVELDGPHRHADRAAALLREGRFARVLAAVHSAALDGGGHTEVSARHADLPSAQVVRTYLADTLELVEQFGDFEVLAHLDYPVRSWPGDAGPYDPGDFEEEYRHVLRALAASGRVLEFNTRVPLHGRVLVWWRQEGGRAVSFGSDAHDPAALAAGFRDAARTAEAAGFRPGPDPYAFWRRA
ncbi:PHP domain-containing protein [Streptomyces avicenniae]|uniref:PHP domain-containing protein n=1 Tax=Streptomyces avicenniae TaxID=500153 RepID=UPI00069C5DAE|nr:PHP domain-containing protein [Streptomyces avicenniae]